MLMRGKRIFVSVLYFGLLLISFVCRVVSWKILWEKLPPITSVITAWGYLEQVVLALHNQIYDNWIYPNNWIYDNWIYDLWQDIGVPLGETLKRIVTSIFTPKRTQTHVRIPRDQLSCDLSRQKYFQHLQSCTFCSANQQVALRFCFFSLGFSILFFSLSFFFLVALCCSLSVFLPFSCCSILFFLFPFFLGCSISFLFVSLSCSISF